MRLHLHLHPLLNRTLGLACLLLGSTVAAGGLPELAYVSIRTGDAHIWVRDAAGQERQLTQSKSIHVQPSLAADGRVAFVGREGPRPLIMLMQADGSGLRALNATDGTVERNPAWSPDGKRLAYFSQQDSDTWLCIADADGKRRDVLRAHAGDKASQAPVWSADGSRLLFIGTDDKRRLQVWVLDADGGNLRNVSAAHAPRGALTADLSPDGQQVAWIANFGDQGVRLVVTDLRTAESRTLFEDEVGVYETPRWSADGRWIAFSASLLEAAPLRSDVFIVRPDGSGLRNLSRRPSEDFDPRWSADGRHLVYLSLRDGGSSLMQVELESGEILALSQHRSHDMEHVFRPRP